MLCIIYLEAHLITYISLNVLCACHFFLDKFGTHKFYH